MSRKGDGPTPMKVMCVAGARPNFMKIAPIVRALDHAGADTTIVHTGQHYDAMMSDVFFHELGVRTPDHALNVGSGSHAQQTARIMSAFEPVLEQVAPDFLIVVGDVNSTMACALVAAKTSVKIAHVEAGLRSNDRSMPEEINRLVTDVLSHLLLAPSEDAVDNLLSEGVPAAKIRLVGNVMADSLLSNIERARQGDSLTRLGLGASPFGLVTLHRPALVDDPTLLDPMLEVLGRIGQRIRLVWPVHPRTRLRLTKVPDGIQLVDPLGYLDFIALEDAATVVLTDSGGVQEETTMLGTPCLTLRPNTERPITVDEGTNVIVGTDPQAVFDATVRVLSDPPPPRRPALWDGRAASRIVEAIAEFGHG